MDVTLEQSWKKRLAPEFEKSYFKELVSFVKTAYQTHQIFPPRKLIFKAFDACPFDNVKVVILGQDPYHGPGQAHGLSFSVPDGVAHPPSLRNIFKEIQSSLAIPVPQSGNLERWAHQGVLLLNATLTVEAHLAGSHQGKGWEAFTDAAIQAFASEQSGIVFMLWGSYAQKKGLFIDPAKHLILKAPHPSPLSAHRGFLGCGHFEKANTYLISKGKKPINW